MVTYEFDPAKIKVTERHSGVEYEFEIDVLDEEMRGRLKQLRLEVENNDDLTDVVFGTQPGNHYVVNVRTNYRVEFLLLMFKYELLVAVKR
ncbi:hypothetical protein OS242_12380 [Tumebacillus sp. DT12]|uniref:Uncharacterized protein n=1 Tax=Tumebacillus lacus TaxID=2995335 RepID=A0ABT3X4J6_9BACL|nr:hypothetical protein [Tumebacillus lacus]MCX7570757.1 hypothetical protein [Tumebacillus lacus]